MSTDTFKTIGRELLRQKSDNLKYDFSTSRYCLPCRRASISSPEVNRVNRAYSLDSQSRDALYASLPFVAAFGMHTREKSLKRVLSSVSPLEQIADSSEAYVRHLPPSSPLTAYSAAPGAGGGRPRRDRPHLPPPHGGARRGHGAVPGGLQHRRDQRPQQGGLPLAHHRGVVDRGVGLRHRRPS